MRDVAFFYSVVVVRGVCLETLEVRLSGKVTFYCTLREQKQGGRGGWRTKDDDPAATTRNRMRPIIKLITHLATSTAPMPHYQLSQLFFLLTIITSHRQ